MNTDRIGIITFFGILIPGSYLAGTLLLAVMSLLTITGQSDHLQTLQALAEHIAVWTIGFLFISYLLGVLVRLFAPDFVDAFSSTYLRFIRRKDDEWIKDYFPYKQTLSTRFMKDGMNNINILLERLNPQYGQKRNTIFFNYCKLFIDSNDLALSKQIQQAEAFVRFLSGTTLVLLIAIPIFLIFLIIFIIQNYTIFWIIYSGLLAMALICLCLILERFKYQRRREVILVWSSIFLIINGGAGKNVNTEEQSLIDKAFFPSKVSELEKDTAK